MVAPPVLTKLLTMYGYHTTFRALGIFFLITIGPLLPLIRGRLPAAKVSLAKSVSLENFRNPGLWLLLFCNFLQGAGNYLPSLYIYTQATSLGISANNSSVLLVLLQLSANISRVAFGVLSDTFETFTLMALSSAASALVVLCVWGFASTFAPLLLFALAFGFFSGGYTALWAWAAGTIAGRNNTAGANSIVGFCSSVFGAGTLAFGPIAFV
jgi:predicted MFS family arabinose efflux permease